MKPIADTIQLTEAYPARLAAMLQSGSIDIGLIPVAAIKQLPEYYLAGHYCIGAVGNVASVCLFSEVPIAEIENIYLDYQSRSSVALLQWLLKQHWKKAPNLIQATDESYITAIKGTTAGLVIGDRALQLIGKIRYAYDLAGEWKAATGLPFVFAAWVSTQPLSDDFITDFDAANAYGLQHIDEVIATAPPSHYDLKRYYAHNLSYTLDQEKRKGMALFLSSID